MPFVSKDWQDSPSTATPISAAALEDLETRVAAYADTAAPFINVKTDFGAVGDDTADDTTAIQNAINSVPAGSVFKGGTLFFPPGVYKCTGQLSANRANGKGEGLRMVGAGGILNSHGGNPTLAATLRFTGTGSGSFLDFRSAGGVQLVNLGVEYTSSSYTGNLIDFSHDTTAIDAAYALIQDCLIGGYTPVTAASCITFDNAILCRVVGGKIGGAVAGIKFVNAGYSNAHQVIGVTFDHCTTAGLMRAGQTLTVADCWFEGTSPNSLTRAYYDDRNNGALAYGLNIRGCWMGDGGPGAGDAWIDFGTGANSTQPVACVFESNVIAGGTGTGIKFGNGGQGLVIHGNFISGVGTSVDLGAVADGVFDGVSIQGNYLASGMANISGHRNVNISANAGTGGDNNQPSDRITISGHLQGARPRAVNPTVASNTANGSTGTATLTGESADMVGTITVTPGGTGITAGVLATVTLAEAMLPQTFSAVRPKVQFTARNDNAAALAISNDATGNSTFTIRAATAPTSGQAYIWDWFMVGGVQ